MTQARGCVEIFAGSHSQVSLEFQKVWESINRQFKWKATDLAKRYVYAR